MAPITCVTDVAPYLQRGLVYRCLRMQKWQALYEHDRAKTGQFFNLLIEVVAVAFFVAGIVILGFIKLGGLHCAPRH